MCVWGGPGSRVQLLDDARPVDRRQPVLRTKVYGLHALSLSIIPATHRRHASLRSTLQMVRAPAGHAAGRHSVFQVGRSKCAARSRQRSGAGANQPSGGGGYHSVEDQESQPILSMVEGECAVGAHLFDNRYPVDRGGDPSGIHDRQSHQELCFRPFVDLCGPIHSHVSIASVQAFFGSAFVSSGSPSAKNHAI
jgi:hypothetical protein